MTVSDNLLKLHIHAEGCELEPYLCPAKVPTIGIGMTYYPETGKKVTMQDKPLASKEEAIRQWKLLILTFEKQVSSLTKGVDLTQGMYDALVDFQYNTGALNGSTLLKKIKANPKNKTIWGEFLQYTKSKADKDGKDNDGDGLIDEPGEMQEWVGLVKRRNTDAHLYFLNELKFY